MNILSLSRLALITVCLPVVSWAIAAERPNILLMIADDLTYKDIGCLGSPNVKTPNLDHFASEGMTFSAMFNAAATCSPTRHAVYSGMYNVRTGAYPNHTFFSNPKTKSIFTHLKELGYRVGLQGKVHVGPEASFPWEYLGESYGDIKLNKIEEFINRDPKQPWFLVFASHDPHSPWTLGPKDLYHPDKITVPPYMYDTPSTRTQLCQYYAEITHLDQDIGRLLDLLKSTKQDTNTAALFISEQGGSLPFCGKWTVYDNGVHAAAFFRWPGVVKPGAKNPALVQYVDIAPTFVELAGGDAKAIDTGCPDVNGKRGFDGVSFRKMLEGDSSPIRTYAYAQHTTMGVTGATKPFPSRMISDGRYTLVRNLCPENENTIAGYTNTKTYKEWLKAAAKDPVFAPRFALLKRRPGYELFDTLQDPLELHNHADDPELAPVRKRLDAELSAWMQQQGDKGLETENQYTEHQERGNDGKDEQ